MPNIHCEATLFRSEEAGPGLLAALASEASAALPSRGMVMVEGTLNGLPFRVALEPDGKGSHWFRVPDPLLEEARAGADDTVTLEIEPTNEWPEPKVPQDVADVLAADPEARAIWAEITPMARWDWIRWVGAAKQPETRRRRVESIGSRLRAGKRRPCCFDRSQCTLTDA